VPHELEDAHEPEELQHAHRLRKLGRRAPPHRYARVHDGVAAVEERPVEGAAAGARVRLARDNLLGVEGHDREQVDPIVHVEQQQTAQVERRDDRAQSGLGGEHVDARCLEVLHGLAVVKIDKGRHRLQVKRKDAHHDRTNDHAQHGRGRRRRPWLVQQTAELGSEAAPPQHAASTEDGTLGPESCAVPASAHWRRQLRSAGANSSPRARSGGIVDVRRRRSATNPPRGVNGEFRRVFRVGDESSRAPQAPGGRAQRAAQRRGAPPEAGTQGRLKRAINEPVILALTSISTPFWHILGFFAPSEDLHRKPVRPFCVTVIIKTVGNAEDIISKPVDSLLQHLLSSVGRAATRQAAGGEADPQFTHRRSLAPPHHIVRASALQLLAVL
jgi:hypothetical protein